MIVALVGGSAGAKGGGGSILSNALLCNYFIAKWSAKVGADKHEIGPSSAAPVISMSTQLTIHTHRMQQEDLKIAPDHHCSDTLARLSKLCKIDHLNAKLWKHIDLPKHWTHNPSWHSQEVLFCRHVFS